MSLQQTKNSGEWVRGLDSIRFVLAMIVFLSHLPNAPAMYLKEIHNPVTNVLGIIVNHAFLGVGAVIAFFIISGFVIHYPFRDRELNVKQFLVRRWLRIGLPLIVTVAFALWIDRFNLIPIWSLYCELIYYTIYPVLRRLPLTWKQQFWIAFALAAVLIVAMSGNELRSMLTQSNQGYDGSYVTLGDGLTWIIGLPCWLIGVMIAEKIDFIKENVSRLKIYTVRIIVWAAAGVIVELKARWFVSYIFTLNFYAILLGYWLALEIVYFRTHKASPILEYAGKFSYSLYLLHGLSPLLLITSFNLTLVNYPLMIVATVFVSYLFYLSVEMPSHKLSKYLASKV